MATAKSIKDMMRTVVRKEQARERRIQPDKAKEILLNWLVGIKIPAGSAADSWEDLIQEFPVDDDSNRDTGAEMLLAVRLATRENRYLITVMRDLSLDQPGHGTVSTHVNWKPTEKAMQAAVERTYTGDFDDILRAKHAIWAQTFRIQELRDALNSCAIAIISHELRPAPDDPVKLESVPLSQPQALQVPKMVNEEA